MSKRAVHPAEVLGTGSRWFKVVSDRLSTSAYWQFSIKFHNKKMLLNLQLAKLLRCKKQSNFFLIHACMHLSIISAVKFFCDHSLYFLCNEMNESHCFLIEVYLKSNLITPCQVDYLWYYIQPGLPHTNIWWWNIWNCTLKALEATSQ